MSPIFALIFEGGGVKGIGHVGALKELERNGHLKNVTRYAGTSVGGVLACCLAIGMSIDDAEKEVMGLDIHALKECDWAVTKAYNLLCRGGLHKMRKIRAWFSGMIHRYGYTDESTLKDHFTKTNVELVMCTTKLNKREPLYMHHSTTPDITILDAMCMTANFPGYFTYHEHKGNIYVDGGICDNYPYWVFNDMGKLYRGEFHDIDKSYMDETSLGLKVLEKDETNSKVVYKGNDDIGSVASVMESIINTLFLQIERAEISDSYINQTVGIHTGEISSLDFELTQKERQFLINSGKIAAELYILKHLHD
jgi:NTE family protein